MRLLFTLSFVFFTLFSFANNIQLQKVSLSDTNRTAKTVNIKMNISWEHSWRDSINWDAAWIIVKFKEPKDSIWRWKHATLSRSGNNTGTANGVKIVVPEDLTGAFFYRAQIGEGSIASENVKLLWNYGAAGVTNIDSVEVRVFATEMVYVPEGGYCLGDGGGTAFNKSPFSFQLKNSPYNYAVINNNWSPLIVTGSISNYTGDDQVIMSNGIRISGSEGLDINNDKIADNPDFPTGYRGFYCMKYKLTQGQYTDFLNTISANDTTATATDQNLQRVKNPYDSGILSTLDKRFRSVTGELGDNMYYSTANTIRNTIAFDSVQLKFNVSRPDRTYANMTLNKGMSFSEWSGLRPMSELEFEKASRGPLAPVAKGKAWGDSILIGQPYPPKLSFSGVENGNEYFTNYNINLRDVDPVGILTFGGSGYPATEGGDGGVGPYRAGIFASDSSTRISSGASYYGIMDLSKITSEIVIPVSNSTFRLFNGNKNGKGTLNAFGNNYTFGAPNYLNVPHTAYKRSFTSERGYENNYYLTGFRAVRLAPSDN